MKLIKTDSEILKLIQKDECTSRIELAKKLNLSQAAISKRIKTLLLNNYLVTNFNKNKKTKGRSTIGLEINMNLGVILGIYFAHEKIFIVISTLNGEFLDEREYPIDNIRAIDNKIFEYIDEFFCKYYILCIGIAMNGIVDTLNGISIYSASYNWNNKNLKSLLEKKYKIPIYMENAVNLILLYEKKYNLDKNIKNFLVINIGAGVGAGVFLNNEIYQGDKFNVGEIGHIPYDYSSEALLCNCGGKGCLETLLSDFYIENKVYKETGIKYSIDDIIERANRGEIYFRNVFFNLIPILMNIMFWSFSLIAPQKIIIYGNISKCNDFFWKEFKRRVIEGNLNKNIPLIFETRIFRNEIVIKGAVLLALEQIFYKI